MKKNTSGQLCVTPEEKNSEEKSLVDKSCYFKGQVYRKTERSGRKRKKGMSKIPMSADIIKMAI